MPRIDPTRLELTERVVQINRVSKVVKGGRASASRPWSSLATAAVTSERVWARPTRSRGDQEGHRGREEAPHPRAARRSHHPASDHGGLRRCQGAPAPASKGTGVIAGGSVRAVVESAGISDILSKSLGSTNPVNVVMATMTALKALRSADQISEMRGINVGRKKPEAEELVNA
jgi:small subunit ribosomal protein S5